MASTKPEKLKLYETLKQRPRKLGEANELVLLARGPGCILRILLAIFVFFFIVLGVHRGLGDVLVSISGKPISGVVTDVVYTNTEVNERELYRIYFDYAPNEKPYSNFCYSTESIPEPGQEVKVFYSSIIPRFARIQDTSMGSLGTIGFSIFVFLILLFGIPGINGFFKTLQWRRLLREGHPNWARLASKSSTNVEINNQTQYKLTFAYEDSTGKSHELSINEHRPEELRKLQDESDELMLYDPEHPDFAVIWDALPFKFRLNRNGEFVPPQGSDLIWSIVLLLFTYGTLLYGLNGMVLLFR